MPNDDLIETLKMVMDLTVDGRRLSSGTGILCLKSRVLRADRFTWVEYLWERTWTWG
jgi:hypothetical protein